jgi:hypothetical protein
MADVNLATAAGNAAVPAPVTATAVAPATAPALTGRVTRSATSQAGPSTAPAALFTTAAASSSQSAAPAGTSSPSAAADSDDEGNESDVDPAEGGAAYYHSREIAREGPSWHFVYREIPGLHYDEETPELTFPRRVQFPAMGMQWFSIRVCTIGACDVCGSLEDD